MTFHSEDEVKKEFISLYYNPSHVRQFIKNGIKLPMFMVLLPSNSESKNIFNLSTFFYLKIRVEAYRNSGPAQCYNCQGFGHSSAQSSAHCGYPPKYVKCVKNQTFTLKQLINLPLAVTAVVSIQLASKNACPSS